jgi:protein-S-isoprenylcysteine O-methyltransferase Ste14
MAKLSFYGAGPKIGRVALPYLAITITWGIISPRLFTSGTYAFCRNPLYASIILLIIPGIALLSNSVCAQPVPGFNG